MASKVIIFDQESMTYNGFDFCQSLLISGIKFCVNLLIIFRFYVSFAGFPVVLKLPALTVSVIPGRSQG
jgi:hypothetical protein